ncbi:MAG: hypothetical protein Q4B14_00580, partial [Clostridia bacterium]|nr:hypothetical protein [Clostridia bacterium]
PLRFILVSFFFVLVLTLLHFKDRKIYDFIYKYRYLLASLVLILCVFFKLSGSSVGCWNQCMGDGVITNEGVLWGESRALRGDEWATNTPMAISQHFNNYSYFTNIIRGDLTDSFIVYGQPVLSFAEIFRPFHWGYLILGSEMGLSFFWCARFIALFMISFEFSMMFFKKNKPFSLLYAVFITCSPVLQWWFAINGLAEMLIFGQLAVIIINLYMKTDSYIKRILFAFIIYICAGGFVLTFYPAWQIPFAYVFLALAVSVIVRNFKTSKLSLLKDGLILLTTIILLAVSLGLIIMTSFDTIQAVLNTEYPGKRMLLGGDEKDRFFAYPSNLFFAFDGALPPNVCEQALFLDFSPLGIILALFIMIKNKKPDSILVSLIAINAFLISYCVVEFSPLLAKLTLMTYSASGREIIVISFVNLLILFRASAMLSDSSILYKRLSKNTISFDKFKPFIVVLTSLIFAFTVSYLCRRTFPDYMLLDKFIIAFIFLFLGALYFIAPKFKVCKKFILPLIAVFLIVIASFVNPIRKGLDVIYENDIYKSVSNVTLQDKDGIWIMESMDYPSTNFSIMAGAPTVNSTNVYPNMNRWALLDPDGEYSEIYNRYAHIKIVLQPDSNGDTYFELISPDYFLIMLNINDLQKLNISYILSANNLETLSNDSVVISKIDEASMSDNHQNIFKVTYNQ